MPVNNAQFRSILSLCKTSLTICRGCWHVPERRPGRKSLSHLWLPKKLKWASNLRERTANLHARMVSCEEAWFFAHQPEKMVRIAGLEPAKPPFTGLHATGANGVSLPFIAHRVTKKLLVLQCFIAISGNCGRKNLCKLCAKIHFVQKLCKLNVAPKSVQTLCKLCANFCNKIYPALFCFRALSRSRGGLN
jgi:hypothetical protein